MSSHFFSGILNLAASIVSLLYEFFPDSLDELKPDQGMYEGPRPVLLDSTEIELPGTFNVRTEGIEFGAQQVSKILINGELLICLFVLFCILFFLYYCSSETMHFF